MQVKKVMSKDKAASELAKETNPRDYFERILFEQDVLEAKIAELAMWVNKTYAHSKSLVLIGLLKGCVPFMAQLIKSVTVLHEMDFMTVSSYKGGTKTTGQADILMDLKNDINGKDVLIIEDIIDSGITLQKIMHILKTEYAPTSVKVLVLFEKQSTRKVEFNPDKYGFIIPDVFIVGFGLDVGGKLRNLPYVGVLAPKYIKEFSDGE